MKAVLAGVLLTMCWSASKSAALPADVHERVLVAILRLDGLIVPFAEWRQGRWDNAGSLVWSDERREPAPSPWFRRSQPLPTSWRAVDAEGATTPVRTTEPVTAAAHCQLTWALACDYPQRPVERSDPHRNVGIALSGAAAAGGFETLTADGPDGRRFLALLDAEFVRLEDAAVAGAFRPGAPRATRRKHAVTVAAIWRSREPIGGRWIFHVRLERHYPSLRRDELDCESVSVLSGWVSEDAGAANNAPRDSRVVARRLFLTDCDRKSGDYTATPVGIVTVDNRTFVVTVEHGYEGERYVLLETDGRTIRRVFVVEGGGC